METDHCGQTQLVGGCVGCNGSGMIKNIKNKPDREWFTQNGLSI